MEVAVQVTQLWFRWGDSLGKSGSRAILGALDQQAHLSWEPERHMFTIWLFSIWFLIFRLHTDTLSCCFSQSHAMRWLSYCCCIVLGELITEALTRSPCWAGWQEAVIVLHRKEALTLASKKSLAPLTPSWETSISESFARAISPLSSCSSPAAALWKMSRNYKGKVDESQRRPLRDLQSYPLTPAGVIITRPMKQEMCAWDQSFFVLITVSKMKTCPFFTKI